MTWTPEHPNWNMGTKDYLLASLETEQTKNALPHAKDILDVGSGSGFWASLLWPDQTITKVDKHATGHVLNGSILDLPFPDNSFNLVHARRVLSNLPYEDRAQGIRELKRVSTKWIVIADVFKTQHKNINNARTQAGLKRLPDPHEGMGPLSRLRLSSGLGRAKEERALGASYYVWTRLTLPIMLGRDVPYDANELRQAYPAIIDQTQLDMFGVHRLFIFDLSEENHG